MKKMMIIAAVLTFAAVGGCSTVKKAGNAVGTDIRLEDQRALNDKYIGTFAWTRGTVEDLTEREQPGEPKKRIIPRDTKVEIVELNFTYSGAVVVEDTRSRRRRKIVHGLDCEDPLTVAKIEESLDRTFWFDDPTMRHVDYIRKWGNKTARAVVNHEVFIGMDREAALESWGIPTKINSNEIGGKKEEQWVYKEPTRSKYIYIIDGKVSKWEE